MERSRWGTWAPVLILMGLGALSGLASFEALGRLNAPSLYSNRAAPPGRAFTVRRPVLLIVLDGLRDDAARSMPTLQRMAQRGASARLVAGVPTFSAAGYVTLLTGTTPFASGRRTNMRLFPAAVDAVPTQLRSAGRTARVLSDEVDWWRTLLPEAFSEVTVLPPAELIGRAEAWMAASDLLVVHLCGIDAAGHTDGAGSAAYRDAVRAADAQVARLLARWGDRGVVTVVSDHGHTLGGGHGGAEEEVRNTWWVASGPGVAPHTEEVVPSTDVAPTLAAWLGAPPPAHAEGSTLVEWIDAPPSVREQLRNQDAQRVAELARARDKAVLELTQQQHRDRWERAVLVAVLGLALAGWLRRSLADVGAGALAGAIALCAFAGLSGLIWGPPSFSSASGPGWIPVRSAALLLACAAAISAWWLRRLRDPARRRPWLLGIALVSALPAAVLFVLEGAFSDRPLTSDPMLGALPMVLWPVAGAGALFALVLSGWRAAPLPRAPRSPPPERG